VPVPNIRPKRACAAQHGQNNLRGFNGLEMQFLQEEILDDLCYLKPGVIALGRGDVVVDVGANVGVFSHQVCQIVGCEGAVLSIEALPPTFAVLEHNWAAFKGNSSGAAFKGNSRMGHRRASSEHGHHEAGC
jgi:hypothetical protein